MSKYTAIQYIVYLLSRRDYSEQELRLKMRQKSYSENEIEQAIFEAQTHHWQSDQRFCESYIRYRSSAGFGAKKIQQELQLKGVNSEIIIQKLAESEIDWYNLAKNVFNKKKPLHWDLKAKQKMWRFMLGRGFDIEYFNDLINGDYNE
ncbi:MULTISPECIES: recombination regulator RecX [Pasteurellaceae]|uniref:Regulatory protein RecX n=1 Tax=Pasteurella atlantica TaxID=2827233 RepID=A0AAW8CRC2_9PAST|nr:recombination regulator RecX [Pasteurella atlantica]MBR0574119.1 recombination regulator RecX [Pasteurella atlantica]MDP8040022.1 recombination regulator RecX [Pasteurella atlantica]MDP8042169.1 recombination regulator RecX [Pasteurella atlantica]MDP8044331.1 recombination regulator RecX [Pasteurella atlantica]MDP8046429.1 recombination regulator RecX [Pasteurella atlantica]